MSSTQIVITLIVIVVVAVLAAAVWYQMRRRALRERFGPEYERVVSEQDGVFAAERELRTRERRHAELELRPLSAQARAEYSAAWEETQARFVETPTEAVGAAHELVTRLVAERGYPAEDHDEQLATLSVEHARTLDHYRKAVDIYRQHERGEADTEQLRQALVHYRALFAELLDDEPAGSGAGTGAGTSAGARGSVAAGPRDGVAADSRVEDRAGSREDSRVDDRADARDRAPVTTQDGTPVTAPESGRSGTRRRNNPHREEAA